MTCAANRWTLERQVRLAAGLIVLAATLLSVFVNPRWVYLAMFVGAGLTFAVATNISLMAWRWPECRGIGMSNRER